MEEKKTISGKKLLAILISLFGIAMFGLLLEIAGISQGKYLVYISVPIGALLTIGASFGAMLGLIERDF